MKLPSKIATAILATWTSRKLWTTLIGVIIVYGLYRDSVMLLWSFSTPESIVAFNSMYQTAMICITAIVATYCGVDGFKDMLKRNVTDVGQQIVDNVFHKEESKSEQIITVRTEGGAKAFDEGDIP